MNRYARHIHLFGKKNFSKISNTKVLVAGAGGLGSTVLQLLSRYGFGEIHVYEYAVADSPDMNRQILYEEADIGLEKIKIVAKKLPRINSAITIKTYPEKLTTSSIVPKADIVVDCLDNFESRLTLDELFFKKGIPVVHGGIYKYIGQVTSLVPGKTKNFGDTFGMKKGENYPEFGGNDIFPPVVSLIASIQVSETIKLVSCPDSCLLLNKILLADLLNNTFETIELKH